MKTVSTKQTFVRTTYDFSLSNTSLPGTNFRSQPWFSYLYVIYAQVGTQVYQKMNKKKMCSFSFLQKEFVPYKNVFTEKKNNIWNTALLYRSSFFMVGIYSSFQNSFLLSTDKIDHPCTKRFPLNF